MTRAVSRAVGAVAGVQALLRIAPVVIQAVGGRGLPAPGSYNDPGRALQIIGSSPEVPIVAGLICATGVTQVFIVLALADRVPRWARVSVPFGIIAAGFLMVDGAIGMAALPQLAHLAGHQDAADGAYLAILGIRNGIDRVIPLTTGCWALATALPAWRHHGLPRTLAATGILLGGTGIAGAVLPAAGLASLILAILWTAGLARTMGYEPCGASSPRS